MSLIVELDSFKFHLISLLLWLAGGGTKGNYITEEGLTRLKRLVNPRLQEVSLCKIIRSVRPLTHFRISPWKPARGLYSKRERWILGWLYHITQADVCLPHGNFDRLVWKIRHRSVIFKTGWTSQRNISKPAQSLFLLVFRHCRFHVTLVFRSISCQMWRLLVAGILWHILRSVLAGRTLDMS